MYEDVARQAETDAWTAALNEVLPDGQPLSTSWMTPHAVISALAPFVKSGFNHVLLPRRGGMDMSSVCMSAEPDCIELSSDRHVAYVGRPKRLILEFFPDAPLESFLLLELDALAPSGVYSGDVTVTEELVEIAPVEYIDRSYWESRQFGYDADGNQKAIPEHARIVTRWLAGKVMVVARSSLWNSEPVTYDGMHSAMTAIELRQQIEWAIRHTQS
jgi:serine/threonine-protein kinase